MCSAARTAPTTLGSVSTKNNHTLLPTAGCLTQSKIRAFTIVLLRTGCHFIWRLPNRMGTWRRTRTESQARASFFLWSAPSRSPLITFFCFRRFQTRGFPQQTTYKIFYRISSSISVWILNCAYSTNIKLSYLRQAKTKVSVIQPGVSSQTCWKWRSGVSKNK